MFRKRLLPFFLAIGLLLWSMRRSWYTRRLDLPPVRNRVKVRRRIPIPMPDGVSLMADHYAPAGPGDFPTVLIRSPYGRGWEAFPAGLLLIFAANRFAERGYHVLVQVTRGQFDSGGDFVPFVHEKEDGLATLAWLRQQPWFNGQVGMWGNSYLGLVQWALAGEAGAELQALVPVTTSTALRRLVFADDVFALELAVRWVLGVAGTGEGIIRQKPGFWQQLLRTLQADRLVPAGFETTALRDADSAVLGEPATFFQRWLETEGRADHPYWQAANFKEHLGQTTAAVHHFAGWYDIFLRDQLDDYRRQVDLGHSPYLTIGPWGHTDGAVMSQPLREAIIWCDAQLKGDRSRLRQRPVRLFVMGAEEWRELDSYPPAAREIPFYLHPDGILAATPADAAAGSSRFTYDPADPTPSLGGNLFSAAAGRVDNASLEARSDVIFFTTEPLAEDLEIIGPVSATVYLRAATAHSDLFVRLNDVNAQGLSTNVCDGLRRIAPESVAPAADGSLRVTVELCPTAFRFRRGHRLRLLLAGGAHPRWARNPGSSAPAGAAGQFVLQEHVILHDALHPSALALPQISS